MMKRKLLLSLLLDKPCYQAPKCLSSSMDMNSILNSSDIDVSTDDYELGDEDEDDWD